MTNVARCGVDTAGGLIAAPSTPRTVLVNGAPIALAGDLVTSHGSDAHAAAALTVTKPRTVLVNGLPVVVTADLATCGHPVVATSNVVIASAV